MKLSKVLAFMAVSMLALGSVTSYAKDVSHRIVIQVSSADAKTQHLALNNVANVEKAMGPGNVTIEVVAYGPGLSILTAKNKQASRVKSMAMNDDITFSACHNTMNAIKRKTGKMPVLTSGVKIVPAGVIRIMELQEKGYTYIRP